MPRTQLIRPVPDWAFTDWATAAGVAAGITAIGGGPLLGAVGATTTAGVLGTLGVVVVVLTAALGPVFRLGGSVRLGPDQVVVTRLWWPVRRVDWDRVRSASLVEAGDGESPGATRRLLVLHLDGGRGVTLPVSYPLHDVTGGQPGTAIADRARTAVLRALAEHGTPVRGTGERRTPP